MKKYFDRKVIISEETEVTRIVTEKNGVATVRHDNQVKEVAPVNGSPLDRSTKWKVK